MGIDFSCVFFSVKMEKPWLSHSHTAGLNQRFNKRGRAERTMLNTVPVVHPREPLLRLVDRLKCNANWSFLNRVDSHLKSLPVRLPHHPRQLIEMWMQHSAALMH